MYVLYNNKYYLMQNADQSIQNFLNFDPNAVILRYHGYVSPVFLYEKYLNYTEEKPGPDAWNSYLAQVEDVQTVYNSELLNSVSESVQQQTAIFNKQISAAGANLQKEMAKLSANIQQLNAKKAALKQAEKARNEARTKERLKAQEQSRQRDLAKRQQEMARIASGYNGMDDRNRGAQRQMQTSDLAQYQAMQMSDAVYGQAATNHALAQQRQYDAQINSQQRITAQNRAAEQRNYEEQLTQQSLPFREPNGETINAITASGSHVQIKVNGNSVIAYSTSNSTMGGAQWASVNNNVSVGTTRALYESADITSRYEYAADIQGIGRVYWGPVQNGMATQSQVPGTVMTAVDKNGRSLSILVSQNEVKGYSLGSLNAAGSEYRWTYSHMRINVRPTEPSDGEFAERFKNKADFPDIGTVYF